MQLYSISPALILFFIFLTLKLCGVIHWSYWWVTCPLWIGPALFLAIAVVVLILALCGVPLVIKKRSR